jgi:hypothetical protein
MTKPEGVGLWVWYLDRCEGGDLDKIIERCKTHNISWLAIKAFDGARVFASSQFADAVDPLRDAGIQVYGWGYCYGRDSLGEGFAATRTLELGADGYIFDAEQEFENSTSPVSAATDMLSYVRRHFPNTFLAYSPFAIPSYHRRFPYEIFEQYTDAVMPMVYWRAMNRTPIDALKWHRDDWRAELGSIPIGKDWMPIGQAYSGVSPSELKSFSEWATTTARSFWAWQDSDEYDMDSVWKWRTPVVEDPKMKDLRIGADATRALNQVVARLRSNQSEMEKLARESGDTQEAVQNIVNAANGNFAGRG